MKSRHLVTLGLSCAIAGCDISYGVVRRAPLLSVPPLDCIRGVIESTPGVEKVDYSTYEGGTAITLSGLKSPANVAYTYFYRGAKGSHIIGILQVHRDHNGVVSLSQNLSSLNEKPPQADIDASRPVMASIEQRLESKCGIVGLANSITETCRGVECSRR